MGMVRRLLFLTLTLSACSGLDPIPQLDGGADASRVADDASGLDASGLDASGPGSARDASERDGQSATDSALEDAAGGRDGALTDAGPAIADSGPDSDARAPDAGAPVPPYAVGTLRFEVDAGSGRVLPVQLWYPAVESARAEAALGHPVSAFEAPGSLRTKLEAMLANSPDGCTQKTMHAALAPAALPSATPYPAVVFSHCQDCVRFSTFSVAEELARRGIVVAAPDHVEGTIYDGTGILNEEFLQVRAHDVRAVLDALLAPASTVLPLALRGHVDAARMGMYGHSYGAITTGRVLRDEPRVKAGVVIAAPISVPFPYDLVTLAGTPIPQILKPTFFFAGSEDSSLFTDAIDQNVDDYRAPVRLLTLKDAGHWSFTDIAGFNGTFQSGCGSATRQGSLFQRFDYLDNASARAITTRYVVAFFASQLLGSASATAELEVATPAASVSLRARP
jgi:dienelactone hydrolase